MNTWTSLPPPLASGAFFSGPLLDTNALVHRCFHVFRIKLEDGVPVVLAKEHDAESCRWVGKPDGKGWPIFVDPLNIPRFSQIKWQPRVPLHNFKDVKRRAQQKMSCWKHQLQVCGDPASAEPAKARKLRRMARAVKWWSHFIAMHDLTFPDGAQNVPNFHVDDGSRLRMDTLVPAPVLPPPQNRPSRPSEPPTTPTRFVPR